MPSHSGMTTLPTQNSLFLLGKPLNCRATFVPYNTLLFGFAPPLRGRVSPVREHPAPKEGFKGGNGGGVFSLVAGLSALRLMALWRWDGEIFLNKVAQGRMTERGGILPPKNGFRYIYYLIHFSILFSISSRLVAKRSRETEMILSFLASSPTRRVGGSVCAEKGKLRLPSIISFK